MQNPPSAFTRAPTRGCAGVSFSMEFHFLWMVLECITILNQNHRNSPLIMACVDLDSHLEYLKRGVLGLLWVVLESILGIMHLKYIHH